LTSHPARLTEISGSLAAAHLFTELEKLKNLRSLHISHCYTLSVIPKVLPIWLNDTGTISKLSIDVLEHHVEGQQLVQTISTALRVVSQSTHKCIEKDPVQAHLAKEGFHCMGLGSIPGRQTCTGGHFGLCTTHTWDAGSTEVKTGNGDPQKPAARSFLRWR
jgi:hypothetical protein